MDSNANNTFLLIYNHVWGCQRKILQAHQWLTMWKCQNIPTISNFSQIKNITTLWYQWLFYSILDAIRHQIKYIQMPYKQPQWRKTPIMTKLLSFQNDFHFMWKLHTKYSTNNWSLQVCRAQFAAPMKWLCTCVIYRSTTTRPCPTKSSWKLIPAGGYFLGNMIISTSMNINLGHLGGASILRMFTTTRPHGSVNTTTWLAISQFF